VETDGDAGMTNNRRQRRLLIVDDDELVGRTLERIARREGFDVRLTCDPEHFLELVGRWHPEICAIDLVMPGMDGVQVLTELARRESLASVIITSGVAQRVLDAAGRSAREHGLHIAGVLPKPFAASDVRGLLKRCADAALSAPAGPCQPSKEPEIDIDIIARALEKNEFFVVYQPKVSCVNGTLAGVESLVRWRHPQAGVIAPGRFIPLVEGSDLMSALTAQIIEMALGWFSRLDTQADREAPLTLSINLSARSLEDNQMVDLIERECRRQGIRPEQLIFELTETSAMQDPVKSLDLLTRLRVMGFHLSLDDFGTGYSSMLQLVRMPFSEIKVDRSFVMSAEENSESRKVIRSIVELGKSLGLNTTAEGIESQWALDYLRSIGCDYGQGYFISQPVEGDVIRQRWQV